MTRRRTHTCCDLPWRYTDHSTSDAQVGTMGGSGSASGTPEPTYNVLLLGPDEEIISATPARRPAGFAQRWPRMTSDGVRVVTEEES